MARTAAWRFSAGLGCTGWGPQSEHKSGAGAADAAGAQVGGRAGSFPGQVAIGDQGPGEPQLPDRGGQQPGPAVGRRRLADADGGPAQGVFAEAEEVLDREAAAVPAPQVEQIVRQRAADPGQPQWLGWAGAVRQVGDADADQGEGRIWGGLIFEEVAKTERVPFRYYAMVVGLISGGLGMIGIGQGLRLLLLILGKG